MWAGCGVVCVVSNTAEPSTRGVCAVCVSETRVSVSVGVDSWVSLIGKVAGVWASGGVVGASEATKT